MTEFKAYLRCKSITNACRNCEFLKQCKELNPSLFRIKIKEDSG